MKKMLVLVLFCLSIIASSAYANSIKLYEQPNDSAKVVTTLKAGTQLIPIYQPKQGDWIKVANPKNGDVGWIKASDIKDPNAPQAIDPEQVQQMMNQMQQKAAVMQQSMQEVLNNMVQQINAMQKALGNENTNGQNVQPIIVVPDDGQ